MRLQQAGGAVSCENSMSLHEFTGKSAGAPQGNDIQTRVAAKRASYIGDIASKYHQSETAKAGAGLTGTPSALVNGLGPAKAVTSPPHVAN
jgi:hypothetical protein